jgi:hypothetical protein
MIRGLCDRDTCDWHTCVSRICRSCSWFKWYSACSLVGLKNDDSSVKDVNDRNKSAARMFALKLVNSIIQHHWNNFSKCHSKNWLYLQIKHDVEAQRTLLGDGDKLVQQEAQEQYATKASPLCGKKYLLLCLACHKEVSSLITPRLSAESIDHATKHECSKASQVSWEPMLGGRTGWERFCSQQALWVCLLQRQNHCSTFLCGWCNFVWWSQLQGHWQHPRFSQIMVDVTDENKMYDHLGVKVRWVTKGMI